MINDTKVNLDADYDLDLDFSTEYLNVNRAAGILQSGRFREAKLLYLSILDRVESVNRPRHFNIIKQLCNHHLATIDLFNKNYTNAQLLLSRALSFIQNEEDKIFLMKLKGQAFMGLGQYSQAHDIFTILVKLTSTRADFDKISNLISIARALYLSDPNKNYATAISILEDDVLKQDPLNPEALTYLTDIAIKRGLGKYIIDHMIMAVVQCSKGVYQINKDTIHLLKRNLTQIMCQKENQNYFDKIKDDMSVYRHMAQVLKEFGAVETSLYIFQRALSFDNVKANPKEIVAAVTNSLNLFEILNNYQKGFEFLKRFYYEYPEMTVGRFKNSEIYIIIQNIDNIYSRTHWPFEYDYSADNDTTNDTYSQIELEILAIHFTLIKFLFVVGCIHVIPHLIKLILPLTYERELHKTLIRNQNSYFLLISQLIGNIYNIPTEETPVYVCGDSHALSLAWQTLNGVLFVPKLVTGLKCWHLREDSVFFTKKNFEKVVESIPNKSTVIFIFGEIDCREGIIDSFEKCKYQSKDEAVKITADIYIEAVRKISRKKEFKMLIHPVPPVINLTRNVVKLFNNYLCNYKEFMNFHCELLTEDQNNFNKEYELDDVHMAPSYKKLLKEYLK